jgi:hypothetical protein
MRQFTSNKPGSCLLGALFVLCLAGCKEDIALLDSGGKVVGNGALEITADFPSPARLVLDGKVYTGLWSMSNIYEADLARSRRLIGHRAYTAYATGNDPRQLKHGHASLVAGDGSNIRCDFYFRGLPVKGSCDEDGKQLRLGLHRSG